MVTFIIEKRYSSTRFYLMSSLSISATNLIFVIRMETPEQLRFRLHDAKDKSRVAASMLYKAGAGIIFFILLIYLAFSSFTSLTHFLDPSSSPSFFSCSLPPYIPVKQNSQFPLLYPYYRIVIWIELNKSKRYNKIKKNKIISVNQECEIL